MTANPGHPDPFAPNPADPWAPTSQGGFPAENPPAPPPPPYPGPLPRGDDAAQGDAPSGTVANTADAGKRAAGDVASTASDKAKEVADETRRQARDLVGEARNQLREQAGTQHRNLVSNLRSLADELDGMADNGAESGMASDMVRRAGGHARSAASWLDERQPGDVLDEVRSFARQRPGVFLAGAMLAGVAAGRLTRGAVAAHSGDGESADSAANDQTTSYGGSV